jgi:broad specificity phosphatase PhoE
MAIQTIISTLRHAHTAYSSEKRYAGTIDIGLSDLGIRDAQLASARLKKMSYDIVITSELRRAYETAKIIFDGSTPIVKNQLCHERNFGIMQGMTWEEIQKLTPPILMINVGHDLHTVNPKGGEPFEDVWQRAKMFYHSILREHMGKNILIVSHGVFLQMYHGVIRGLNCIESLAVYPHNMQLTRFNISGVNIISYSKGNW